MAYDLHAIIGPRILLDRHSGRFREVHVAPLRHDFALVPITTWLREETGVIGSALLASPQSLPWQVSPEVAAWIEENGNWAQMALPPFWFLTPVVVAWAAEMSFEAAVVYVQDDCVGGHCAQASLGWRDGQIALGPLTSPATDPAPTSSQRGAINRALRLLWVKRREGRDEFDTLGLGTYRWTDDWWRHRSEKRLEDP